MSSMYCNVKGHVLKNTKEKKLVTNSTDTSKRNSRTEIKGSYLSLRSLIYEGVVSVFKSGLQIPWLLLYQWNCTYKAVANIPCWKITKSNIHGVGTVDCNNRDKILCPFFHFTAGQRLSLASWIWSLNHLQTVDGISQFFILSCSFAYIDRTRQGFQERYVRGRSWELAVYLCACSLLFEPSAVTRAVPVATWTDEQYIKPLLSHQHLFKKSFLWSKKDCLSKIKWQVANFIDVNGQLNWERVFSYGRRKKTKTKKLNKTKKETKKLNKC